jgi:DNA-binding NtrC family response regulator
MVNLPGQLRPTRFSDCSLLSWLGNIRELRNVRERAVALCNEPIIGLVDLPPIG